MSITVPEKFAAWPRIIRRVQAQYRVVHGRAPRLLRPRRYTDKIQWRKLFDLDPRYAILSDKLAVRDLIAERTGGQNLTPLLWHGDDPDRIPFDELTPPYVLKSTHGCGHTIMVGTDTIPDREAIRATARSWLATCHGSLYNEPGYIHVPRRLIIERQVFAPGGRPPVELKFFVFDGQVAIVQSVMNEDGRRRHGAFHTPAWDWRSWYFTRPTQPTLLPCPPPTFDAMLAAATRLGAGFEHVRVDMYDCVDRFYVGEITLYTFSGMQPFMPDEADYLMGSFWNLRRPMRRALLTMLTRPWQVRPAGQADTQDLANRGAV